MSDIAISLLFLLLACVSALLSVIVEESICRQVERASYRWVTLHRVVRQSKHFVLPLLAIGAVLGLRPFAADPAPEAAFGLTLVVGTLLGVLSAASFSATLWEATRRGATASVLLSIAVGLYQAYGLIALTPVAVSALVLWVLAVVRVRHRATLDWLAIRD